MTLLDIAQAARGKLRDGYSAPQAGGAAMVADMAYGTATADSSNGFVTIVMDNMPAGAVQADYEFTVACDAPITDGDRVALVTINGTEKAISMGTLSEQVADVVNYFWADNDGVHVSTEEGDPDGAQNIVLDSSGLTIREGSDVLASFTGANISIGENCTLADIEGATGTVSVNLMDLAALELLMKRIDITGYASIGRVPQLEISLDGSGYGRTGYVTIRNLLGDNAVIAFKDGGILCDGIPASGIFSQTLYSDASGAGQNSTITLSESAASFVWLEFIYTDGTRRYCERLYSPNGKSTSLERSVVSGSIIYHASLMVSVSGTTVTVGAGAQATISSGASVSTTCPLKIIEVRGGK